MTATAALRPSPALRSARSPPAGSAATARLTARCPQPRVGAVEHRAAVPSAAADRARRRRARPRGECSPSRPRPELRLTRVSSPAVKVSRRRRAATVTVARVAGGGEHVAHLGRAARAETASDILASSHSAGVPLEASLAGGRRNYSKAATTMTCGPTCAERCRPAAIRNAWSTASPSHLAARSPTISPRRRAPRPPRPSTGSQVGSWNCTAACVRACVARRRPKTRTPTPKKNIETWSISIRGRREDGDRRLVDGRES